MIYFGDPHGEPEIYDHLCEKHGVKRDVIGHGVYTEWYKDENIHPEIGKALIKICPELDLYNTFWIITFTAEPEDMKAFLTEALETDLVYDEYIIQFTIFLENI